eukprot:scaffold427_cov263-Pinguiococcus_pyrenoidosus.AAC.15
MTTKGGRRMEYAHLPNAKSARLPGHDVFVDQEARREGSCCMARHDRDAGELPQRPLHRPGHHGDLANQVAVGGVGPRFVHENRDLQLSLPHRLEIGAEDAASARRLVKVEGRGSHRLRRAQVRDGRDGRSEILGHLLDAPQRLAVAAESTGCPVQQADPPLESILAARRTAIGRPLREVKKTDGEVLWTESLRLMIHEPKAPRKGETALAFLSWTRAHHQNRHRLGRSMPHQRQENT